LLLPIWSQYSLIRDNISELALGRYGFIQTAAFVIAGVGTLGLALAIRQLTKGSGGSRVGSLLVAVYGAGAILSAFPTDRIDSPTDMSSLSATGAIHIAVAIASFVSVIVGTFVLTRTFARERSWGSFWRLSVFFPLASAMAANKEPASIIAAQLRHADGGALAQRVYIHQLPQTAPRLAELIQGVFGPTARDSRAVPAARTPKESRPSRRA
jgi:hypothetical protein